MHGHLGCIHFWNFIFVYFCKESYCINGVTNIQGLNIYYQENSFCQILMLLKLVHFRLSAGKTFVLPLKGLYVCNVFLCSFKFALFQKIRHYFKALKRIKY